MNYIISLFDISNIKRLSYRKDITILRSIAVTAVVLYHLDYQLFSGGWLGVDIFFVISGYLITNIIVSELNENKFSLLNFYNRRVRRILPALFSTLALSIPFSYILLTPKAISEYARSLLSSVFFYSNYYFENLDFYNSEPTKLMPLLHTWSLAIEEQFYLIFPLLCIVLFKLNKNFFFIFLTLIAFSSVMLNSTTSGVIKFYEIQFRAWELILGSIVMILRDSIKIRHIEKLGIFFIFFSILYFDDSTLSINSIEPKLIACIGVALVLLSKNNLSIEKLSDFKFIYWVGLSSYSLYLLHQPIFSYIRIANIKYSFLSDAYEKIVSVIILLLLSYLNWKYVEQEFQKSRSKKLVVFLTLLLLIILIFVSLSHLTDGYSYRYNYVPEDVLFYSINPNIYPFEYDKSDYKYSNVDCNSKFSKTNYCIWSNSKTNKNIYLIGDSHANALSVSFLINLYDLGDAYNLVFLPNNLGRCLLSQQSDTTGDVPECSEETFEIFLNKLSKENDIVITIGRYNTWINDKGKKEIKCQNCSHIEVFKNRLELIEKNSKKLFIIEPIPTFPFAIAESYLYKKTKWGESIYIDINNWSNRIYETENFLLSLNGKRIKLINTKQIFCDGQFCYASKKDSMYYTDTNHLTLDGANLITNKLIQEIRKLN